MAVPGLIPKNFTQPEVEAAFIAIYKLLGSSDTNFVLGRNNLTTKYRFVYVDDIGTITETDAVTIDPDGAISFRKGFVPLSATTTLSVADSSKVIKCSGTFTVNLPVAADAKGVFYYIKNTGSGEVTVDGSGSETIDGNLTKILRPKSCMVVYCDGTEWSII